MKNLFLLLTLLILVCSCSNNNSTSNSNSQLFRDNYNNTSWVDSWGDVYSFKTDKLFYINAKNQGSFYYTVGTYKNINYDGCIYNTVNNILVSEDADTFSIRQTTSTGVGSNCPASSVIFTFQVLNQNTIEVKTNYDGSIDSYIINKVNSVSTQNAIDGTSAGFLW
jgi:hypothetical protein